MRPNEVYQAIRCSCHARTIAADTGYLPSITWRHFVLALFAVGSFAYFVSLEPIAQAAEYHDFADVRTFAGIPNCLDVVSNASFLLVALIGIHTCLSSKSSRNPMHPAWMTTFIGLALMSAGSTYYHLDPNDNTLVWDRLTGTIGFMGLTIAVFGEFVSDRAAINLLGPATIVGLMSVMYWQRTNDLRAYFWLQTLSMLSIPLLVTLFRNGRTHRWLLPLALAWYVCAMFAETHDASIFHFTHGTVSGHTMKHFFAAIGCLCVALMLRWRQTERWVRSPSATNRLPNFLLQSVPTRFGGIIPARTSSRILYGRRWGA